MTIQSIRIVSNNICYGPQPNRYEEVEQHLAITATGEVQCGHYLYGDGDDYELRKSENVSISKEASDRILKQIEAFIQSYSPIFATDVGEWRMEVIFDDGTKKSINGSMIGVESVESIDLEKTIRAEVPIDNLFLFGGNYKIKEKGIRIIDEKAIADYLLCHIGEYMSTCEVIESTGAYSDDLNIIRQDDWFGLEDMVFAIAEKNGLELDKNHHEGELIGWPWEVDFLIKQKQ